MFCTLTSQIHKNCVLLCKEERRFTAPQLSCLHTNCGDGHQIIQCFVTVFAHHTQNGNRTRAFPWVFVATGHMGEDPSLRLAEEERRILGVKLIARSLLVCRIEELEQLGTIFVPLLEKKQKGKHQWRTSIEFNLICSKPVQVCIWGIYYTPNVGNRI